MYEPMNHYPSEPHHTFVYNNSPVTSHWTVSTSLPSPGSGSGQCIDNVLYIRHNLMIHPISCHLLSQHYNINIAFPFNTKLWIWFLTIKEYWIVFEDHIILLEIVKLWHRMSGVNIFLWGGVFYLVGYPQSAWRLFRKIGNFEYFKDYFH